MKFPAIPLSVLALGLIQSIKGDAMLSYAPELDTGTGQPSGSAYGSDDECYSDNSWLVCQFTSGGSTRADAFDACESLGYALAMPGDSTDATSAIATLMANFPCTSFDYASQFWTAHLTSEIWESYSSLWSPGEPNSGDDSHGVTMRVNCDYPTLYNDSFDSDPNGGYICYTGY